MVRHPGNTPSRPKAFTLVELLVVLGIIAVVSAMLMPSLRRAREQANMAICASNLGQIGKAFLMYAQENGKYPYHADWTTPNKEDWIHWWAGPGRDPRNLTKTSAIAKYLGSFNDNLFHCPADDVKQHPRIDPARPYPFSYSMNGLFASNVGTGVRLAAVQNPSGKIVVLEEDELSLDDGHFWAYPNAFNGPLENFLGSRHVRPRLRGQSTWQGGQKEQRKDRNERGNVAFADGHVELVTRYFTWSDQSMNPKTP